MKTFLIAAAIIAPITGVFWSIGPAGRVLASGDLFTYFYPYWVAATRALQTGQLPLWNQHLFMGVPLLANSQVGFFYPLNWPLWLMLPAHSSLHWSIIVHLWIAAAGTYVFARRAGGLKRSAAWVSATALVLGGYLGAQVEHINQLQALAWLPWMLVLYDQAIERKSALFTSGLAAIIGLVMLAGHSQAAFIDLVGLGTHALVQLINRRGRLSQHALVLTSSVILGVALSGVQLLPTLELASLSMRAQGLPFRERVSFSLSPIYLARSFLPGYGPAVEPENIEFVATIGLAGLALLLVGGWAQIAKRRFPYLACLGLFLALGLYNPVYLLLARFVPGFAHFRAPARWLALWAFESAILIGAGFQLVSDFGVRLSRRGWLVGGGVLAALLAWGALSGAGLATLLGWLLAAALAGGLIAISPKRPRAASVALTALTIVELALSGRTLPYARATAPQAYTSLRPAAAHLLTASQGEEPAGRFLSISALVFDPGDMTELGLVFGDQLSEAALYDLLVAAKHREVLSPNLPLALGIPAIDGYDGGVLPLSRYVTLQRAFLPPEEVSLDGRLRENLTRIPHGRWLNLFNVRYVITDKVFDAWLDDVFYDLQFSARLELAEGAAVAHIPSFEATALGVVSYLDGAAELPDGTAAGEVSIGFADGSSRTFSIEVGRDTAEGVYSQEAAHQQATVGGHFWPGRPEGNDYVTRLRWDEGMTPISIQVQGLAPTGELVIRGVSLIDERTGSFQSLILSDQGHFRLVHSGDVKVYENLDVLQRAFVVYQARNALDEDQALAWMQDPTFDPSREVILEDGADLASQDAETAGEVEITTYTSELVEMQANLSAPGYLVLTDAAYPGWHAYVDGEEVEILTADVLFRAVQLEPGEHRVEMEYRPSSLRIGGVISLSAIAVIAGLSILATVRRRRRR